MEFLDAVIMSVSKLGDSGHTRGWMDDFEGTREHKEVNRCDAAVTVPCSLLWFL